jgi:hypothetical protein
LKITQNGKIRRLILLQLTIKKREPQCMLAYYYVLKEVAIVDRYFTRNKELI